MKTTYRPDGMFSREKQQPLCVGKFQLLDAATRPRIQKKSAYEPELARERGGIEEPLIGSFFCVLLAGLLT